MREIQVSEITDAVRDMCISVNHELSEDMCVALARAEENEKSEIGREVLSQLKDNLDIAGSEMIPICQDTGMAVVFLSVGQDVHFVGGSIEAAINEGVRRGYTDGYLRKSVVSDPIERKNTNDNTPAVIHYSIIPGDEVRITLAPKGFGSENMSRIFMLKPAFGIEGVKDAILTTVKEAGPNACPPMVVGVGVGGTFEKAAILAKQALAEPVGSESTFDGVLLNEYKEADSDSIKPQWARELEAEMLKQINELGIGPAGLGGSTTALSVNVKSYATHIAGLPVAVNICCHVNRHITRVI